MKAKRKIKRVRSQCRYGCCVDRGNWTKFYRTKKLKQ